MTLEISRVTAPFPRVRRRVPARVPARAAEFLKEFWGGRNFSDPASDVGGDGFLHGTGSDLFPRFWSVFMSLFTVLATSKVAAGVLAAGTLAVGGTGVAAVSGALPAEAQQTAHELLGAPAPKLAADATEAAEANVSGDAAVTGEAAVSGDEVSAEANVSAAAGTAVDAAGAAAFGLCTAFTNGGLNESSEGFSSLVIAAEGEANVDAFCADVIAQGAASADAAASRRGFAAVKAERPELPAVPAVPAVPTVPGVDGEPAVPAVSGRPRCTRRRCGRSRRFGPLGPCSASLDCGNRPFGPDFPQSGTPLKRQSTGTALAGKPTRQSTQAAEPSAPETGTRSTARDGGATGARHFGRRRHRDICRHSRR